MRTRLESTHRGRRMLVPGLLSLVLAAAACTSTGDEASPSPSAEAGAAQPVELKVMSFNILYGGSYGFGRMLDVIREVDPDIVGVQEPYGRMLRIADALGWHASPRLHVLSRFPVLEPGGSNGSWGYVEVEPGRVVAILNTHLPSVRYGPYQVRNGEPLKEVLAAEDSGRVPAVHDVLDALAPAVDEGIPTFLTGDFNSPSFRDWTQEVAQARKDVKFPVDWPVSREVENAGFVDTYREIHPDPVADPGYTWTPGSGTPPRIREGEVFDRIDFVWAAGQVEILDSAVAGEAGGKYSDIEFDPWPSDHRAVVSTVSTTPVAPPPTLATGAVRVELGQSFDAEYFTSDEASQSVSLATESGEQVDEQPIPSDSPTRGTVSFDTASLEPGAYVASLLDGGGASLADVSFELVDPQAPPTIEASEARFDEDQPIEVSWTGGPGNRYDWLALTPDGKGPGWYLAWTYIDAKAEGTAQIDGNSEGRWPIPPGEYQFHLCVDDSYRCVASSAPFEVTALE